MGQFLLTTPGGVVNSLSVVRSFPEFAFQASEELVMTHASGKLRRVLSSGWIPSLAALIAVLAIARSALAESTLWFCSVPPCAVDDDRVSCGSGEEGCCCRLISPPGPWKCMCIVPTNPLFVCAGNGTWQCQ